MFKKITSIVLAILILSFSAVSLSSCGKKTDSSSSSSENSSEQVSRKKGGITANHLAQNIEDGAILHCFCWNFETITESLDDIAAAGFSAIQTSPINECLVGENGEMQLLGVGKWYYHFQPTDYTIGNYQLGTREQFKTMCEKADELGIKVIVDVVPNHTTPLKAEVNQRLVDAVGGIDNLYHKNSQKDIVDYSDRLQCTTAKMGGLPDIDTENKDYQDYFIKFLNDCVDCGADGFRYDAAKHIGLPDDPKDEEGDTNNFWERVTTEIHDADRIFNYGEVLQGAGDRFDAYCDAIGACTASSYGSTLRHCVAVEALSADTLKDLDNSNVVTWVESHDNYINDGTFNDLNDLQVKMAWAVISARGDGTPLFFDRFYGNDIDNQAGTMNRIGTSGDQFYKDKMVSEVNFFRNAMIGEETEMYNSAGSSASLQICRGKKGAVIINTSGELNVDFSTDLANGTYTDRVDGETQYTVKDGKITCDKPIPEYSIVVLYNDGFYEREPSAVVKIADDVSPIHTTDTVDVKLECENAKIATYSVNGAEATEYKNGDTITVGTGDEIDGVITLTLRGENEQGKTTYMRYEFTNPDKMYAKYKIMKGDSISFEKPSSWGKDVNAYVYFNGGFENMWPGSAMKKSGSTYTYTFQNEWDFAYIIFNDGTNQYPEPDAFGFIAEKNKTYSIP